MVMEMNSNERYKQIRFVLILTMLLNWSVASAKTFFGWLTGFSSMFADGFHSFSDGFSNIICLVGIWAASKPVDEDHPYGHKKMESFATLGIAFLLMLLTVELLEHSYEKFRSGNIPNVETASYIVMIISMIVNLIVYTYERIQGNKLQSDILLADSGHTKSDFFVSLSVLFTLVAVKLGYPVLDSIVTGIIALLIGYEGLKIVYESSKVLVDRKVIDEEKIKSFVNGMSKVESCHKIRTHGREDDTHMDLHVQVDPGMSVEESHDLSHQIDEKIRERFIGVSEVKVHLEPHRKEEKK